MNLSDSSTTSIVWISQHNATTVYILNSNLSTIGNDEITTTTPTGCGDIMTKQTSDKISYILVCFVFPIITLSGIIGNIISLIVLSQKRIFKATVILLLGLTVADCLFLIANFLRKATCIIEQFDVLKASWYYVKTFTSLYYLTISTGRVSTLLVVAISVERFIAVTFPLKVRTISTKFRMLMLVIFVYILTFGVLSLVPAQMDAKASNGTYYVVMSKFFLKNSTFYQFYNNYVSIILFRWVPKIMIIIFNALIFWKLKTRMALNDDIRTAKSSSSTRRQRDQGQITTMLLVVATVFIVSLLPRDAFAITKRIVKEFKSNGRYKYTYQIVNDISIVFEMINSSINFVIYMALNKTFSSVYLGLFCRCIDKYSTNNIDRNNTSRYSTPQARSIISQRARQTSTSKIT